MAYTLVHLPLFGSVLWISRAVAFLVVRDGRTSLQLLQSAHDEATEKVGCSVDAASFCAALVCYVLCVTVLQMLHRGHGRGRRNLGKTKRLGPWTGEEDALPRAVEHEAQQGEEEAEHVEQRPRLRERREHALGERLHEDLEGAEQQEGDVEHVHHPLGRAQLVRA